MNRLFSIIIVYTFSSFMAYADVSEDVIGWLKNAEEFSSSYPQESVYLHLDNTSYYQGDDIWFKAYVVNPFGNTPSVVSGTLYVVTDPLIDPFSIDKIYGCAVFIETYPDGEIPVDAGKGVRKTRLDGYSTSREFFNPDYSMLEPDAADYRRTLYWNPCLSTDENGEANVRFYNNSSGGTFEADLQTVTPTGLIGSTR